MDPLFIGLSVLHRRHRSVGLPNPQISRSAEYFSSISEDSNAKASQQIDSYHSPKTVITGREFEERNFLPSDFSISSIRDPFNSVLTLTDSNEYRMNMLLQAGSPALLGHFQEPFGNPSLFKKQHKLQLDQAEKENDIVPTISSRSAIKKKGHHNSNSIVLLGENQWFGLKTSRVLSPQIKGSRYMHFF